MHLRKKYNVRRMYGMMFILLLLSLVAGISLGPSAVGITQILPTLLGEGSFKEEFILFSIRMPRVFVLALAGMALALSGAILQTLTKNDLADPGIIGINAGAGISITLFYLFVDANVDYFAYQLPVVGFLGALVTAGLIFLFSVEKRNGVQPVKLVLMGVGGCLCSVRFNGDFSFRGEIRGCTIYHKMARRKYLGCRLAFHFSVTSMADCCSNNIDVEAAVYEFIGVK